MRPSVFIIDDDPSVRDSTVLMLRKEGMRARAFSGGRDFFDRLPDNPVACVITDLRMPDMDGVEVVRRLTELRGSSWAVIVITAHAGVPMAVSLMRSGVVDVIEKPFIPQRLIESVQGCLTYLSATEAALKARTQALDKIERLTPRERQVFESLVEGLANKEIARRLAISPRTVEIFRSRVMAKTEAGSLSALIQMRMRAQANSEYLGLCDPVRIAPAKTSNSAGA